MKRLALAMTAALAATSGCSPSGAREGALPEQLRVSTSQAAILSDGEVTDAEYERAVGATIRCLKAAGLEVEGPRRDGSELRYSATGKPNEGESEDAVDARVDRSLESCSLEHDRHVAAVYVSERDNDELDRRRRTLSRCLEQRAAVKDAIDDDSSLARVVLAADELYRSSDPDDRKVAVDCVRDFND